MRESYSGTCPACGGEIQITHHRLEIPHFPDLLLVSIACETCGYRHTDTIILGEGDPVRWTVQVEGPEDLSIRVVRSTTGTIRIPELGMAIEPGTACEGFITNIEGVLSRFEQAVEAILANPAKEALAAAREAAFPFTVILEDPAGNSMLVSDKARKAVPEEGET